MISRLALERVFGSILEEVIREGIVSEYVGDKISFKGMYRIRSDYVSLVELALGRKRE